MNMLKFEIASILSTLTHYRFNFSSENELQKGLEEVFLIKNVNFEREFMLTKHDRLDFIIDQNDFKIAIEVKIAGTKNALLRQISRYLSHDDINGVIVIGTPYWLQQLPTTLNNKPVSAYRLLGSMF